MSDLLWTRVPGGPTRAMVKRVVGVLFPEPQRAEVLRRLDQYRDNEIPRVQLAILKLSGGDLATLDKWIATAQSDYRDALAYAEFPRQMETNAVYSQEDQDEYRRVVAEDQQQYLDWLHTVGER